MSRWRSQPKLLQDYAIKAVAHYCISHKAHEVSRLIVPVWDADTKTYKFCTLPTHDHAPKFVIKIYEEIRSNLWAIKGVISRILGPPFYPYWIDGREEEADFGFELHPVVRDHYFQGKAGSQWTVESTREIQVHTVVAHHYLIDREEEKFTDQAVKFRYRRCMHGARRHECLLGCTTNVSLVARGLRN